MWAFRALFVLVALTSFSSFSQHLLINEVSQGPSGSKEYVEFVVPGVPTCAVPVPVEDLRKVIIDDNNGYFASGSGQGIAPGAIRFKDIAFWQAIPAGTIIVVYNESDRNGLIPPDDASMSDGNARLILPADSPLLEGTTVSPNNSNSAYPLTDASWTTAAAQWSLLGMANGGDAFQVRMNASTTAPYSGVSWGTNNLAIMQAYFPGTAAGKVFYATSNPFTFLSDDCPANETPGAANNAANATYIATFTTPGSNGMQITFQTINESCPGSCDGQLTATVTGGVAPYTYSWTNPVSASPTISNLCPASYSVTVTDNGGCTATAQGTVQAGANALQVTFNTTMESCAGTCDGSSTAQVTGGAQPYQLVWSNGPTTAANTNLCPGNYTIAVVDDNGCSGTGNITITAGSATTDATILTTGPFSTSDPAIQLQSVTNGGTWLTADCGSCLTTSGMFNPAAAGAGTYQICHNTGSGQCADNDCISITVTQGCTPQTTQETVSFCAEDSVLVFGQWENQAGNYSQTTVDIHGCDSMHTITLTVHSISNNHSTIALCDGDSVLVFGQWVKQPGIYTQEMQSPEGCAYTQFTTVYTENCTMEAFSLFIPNTFTPNGDNTNEFFKIELLGGLVEEGFIFNRWGGVIAKFTQDQLTWDGKTTSGDMVQDGVYTYLVFYTPTGGSREKVHGFVTVLR